MGKRGRQAAGGAAFFIVAMSMIGAAAVAAAEGVSASTAMTAASAAAPGCLPRAEMRTLLAAQYGEQLRAQGLSSAGRLIEIYVNRAGDSWSMTETDTTGRTCLRAAGQFWQMERPETAAPARPAAATAPETTRGAER